MTANKDIHMNTDGLYVDPYVAMHSIWNVQTPPMPNLNGSTIVPHESMLGGPYVRVDSPNLGVESYDDADEPFAQHVVYRRETASPAFVKPESESPDNRGRLKRSICETHTGVRMVKTEQRDTKKGKKGQQKLVKSKKSKSPAKDFLIKLDGELVENRMENVYRDKEGR
jgi:hypothetical protein